MVGSPPRRRIGHTKLQATRAPRPPSILCSKMCVNSAKKHHKRQHSGQERKSQKPHKTALPYTYRQTATPAHKPLKMLANDRVIARGGPWLFLDFLAGDSVSIVCKTYEFIRDSRPFSLSSISPQDGGAVPNIPDRIIF